MGSDSKWAYRGVEPSSPSPYARSAPVTGIGHLAGCPFEGVPVHPRRDGRVSVAGPLAHLLDGEPLVDEEGHDGIAPLRRDAVRVDRTELTELDAGAWH